MRNLCVLISFLVVILTSCQDTPQKKDLPRVEKTEFVEKKPPIEYSEIHQIDFSEKYVGTLMIQKDYEENDLKVGKLFINETKTNSIVLDLDLEGVTVDYDEQGKVKTNVAEIHYGEHSLLIYSDFNFDDKKDLAVMDGMKSCYHGPSFQIYLETDNGLTHSPEFSELGQNYCGMFEIDYEKKLIHTMTKSTCCWHEYSTFKVENNIPVAIKIVEEDALNHSVFIDYVEEVRVNDTMQKTSYSVIKEGYDFDIVLSAPLENGRTMNFYQYETLYNEEGLCFTLEDDLDRIRYYNLNWFEFNQDLDTLTFTDKNTVYKVHNRGLLIQSEDKKEDIGTKGNRKISLDKLVDLIGKVGNLDKNKVE